MTATKISNSMSRLTEEREGLTKFEFLTNVAFHWVEGESFAKFSFRFLVRGCWREGNGGENFETLIFLLYLYIIIYC